MTDERAVLLARWIVARMPPYPLLVEALRLEFAEVVKHGH